MMSVEYKQCKMNIESLIHKKRSFADFNQGNEVVVDSSHLESPLKRRKVSLPVMPKPITSNSIRMKITDLSGLIVVVVGYHHNDNAYNIMVYDMINRKSYETICEKYDEKQDKPVYLNDICGMQFLFRITDTNSGNVHMGGLKFDQYFSRILVNGIEVVNVCYNAVTGLIQRYWVQYLISGMWTEPKSINVNTRNMNEFALSVFNEYKK
jgi:hypothetical protein